MEYSFYDFLALLGSLALFLYGMKIMSEGLQKFAGDRLRNILTAMTTNRVTGVLTGTLITALVQSSSATTVMVYRNYGYRLDYFGFGLQSGHLRLCPSALGFWHPASFLAKKLAQVYRRVHLWFFFPVHGA